MIITVTGKPCSGKGTVCKLFAKEKNFEYLSTGDMFRKLGQELGLDILSFQQSNNVSKADQLIDTQIEELGKARINDDIIIDSRLAWHFIPNSFKVFIDVSIDVASKRLLESNRDSEKVDSLEQAKTKLIDRWNVENDRYTKIYNTNNLNHENYHLVINSDNLTPNEVVEKIYTAYENFIKTR